MVTVAAAVVLMRLFPVALDQYVVLVFLAAIVLAARFGGFGPGLFAILLSIPVGLYFVLEPGHLLPDPDNWPGIAMYTLIALTSVWLIVRRQRAEQNLRALNRTLEQRVAERTAELAHSYELLSRSERLRAIGEMVAGLSHESRNALQRSRAALDLLEKRIKDRPDLLRFLDEARNAQADLQRVYEDVKDYAAPVVPEHSPVPLPAAWREAWGKIGGARGARQAVLVEEIEADDPACEVDRFRIEQVFRNLFENAIDASPDPPVVRVSCRSIDRDGEPFLQVVIRDNGPGIPTEERERVWQPFHTTKTHGTGLGLSIVRRIVEAHGGSIALAQDGPGLGVEIRLPKRAAPDPTNGR